MDERKNACTCTLYMYITTTMNEEIILHVYTNNAYVYYIRVYTCVYIIGLGKS